MCVCVRVCVCVCVFVRTLCACMFAYEGMCMYKCVRICVYKCMCAREFYPVRAPCLVSKFWVCPEGRAKI